MRNNVLIAVGSVVVFFGLMSALGSPPEIVVDGVHYSASKVSGETVHYETPHTNPSSAYTDRNVWTGNGSELLPCEGGIHWIDNENLLTISHCLPGETTTTTTSLPTTTTTVPPTTTTSTEPPSTTTTIPTSTTLPPTTSSTTTVPETTTTDPQTTTTETPVGGVPTGGGACADGACDDGVAWNLIVTGLFFLFLAFTLLAATTLPIWRTRR